MSLHLQICTEQMKRHLDGANMRQLVNSPQIMPQNLAVTKCWPFQLWSIFQSTLQLYFTTLESYNWKISHITTLGS